MNESQKTMNNPDDKSSDNTDNKSSDNIDKNKKSITLHIPQGGELGRCGCETCAKFFGYEPSYLRLQLPPIRGNRVSRLKRRHPAHAPLPKVQNNSKDIVGLSKQTGA